jgi:hypothetical protein
MKKYLLILTFLLSFAGLSFAQTAPAKKAAKATTAQTATPANPTKKDGTPDKRFKANKQVDSVKHVKKDGTPDKRFKENKKS